MNTRHTQASPVSNGPSESQLQLVSFTLGDELFGIDILRVQEINRMMPLTQVSQSEPGIEGVINLRGQIIPVFDLRAQFGYPKVEHGERTRIVVVEISGDIVGFVVDAVQDVLRIPSDIIEPSSQLVAPIDARFLSGVAKLEDQPIMLIELENLFSPESLTHINTIKHAA